jgi:hypothetical protein
MYKLMFFFSILILSSGTIAFADQDEQVITLKDGSQIKGVLAGVDNGVYTVKTPIIGDVHVAASDVSSITNGAGNGTAAAAATAAPVAPVASDPGTAPNLDAEIAASQKKLMSNPQSMATLQEMAQDPDIMKALSDPDLVQAITSHDYQAVQNNPKIQELMNNPKMQALLQKLAAQQQQQNTPSQ